MWSNPKRSNVRSADFKATLNGKPAPITEFLGPRSDLVITVVLDLTGDLSVVGPAKSALIDQIQKLPSNVWVALLHAQDGLSVITTPTPDRAVVSKALNSLPISGKAGFLDTVAQAVQLSDAIESNSDVRVAVLYVTDSDITNYREDFTNPVINSSDTHDLSRKFPGALVEEKIDHLQRQLAYDQPPLFLVHLQYRSSGLNQIYQSGLETLAESMAGFGFFCRSPADIPNEFEKAFTYIQSSSFLGFTLPAKIASSVQVRMQWTRPDGKAIHLGYRARLLRKNPPRGVHQKRVPDRSVFCRKGGRLHLASRLF